MPQNPEQDMRAAMKTAGVHCWCEKSVPVYANSRLVAVHSGVAQELTITLPPTGDEGADEWGGIYGVSSRAARTFGALALGLYAAPLAGCSPLRGGERPAQSRAVESSRGRSRAVGDSRGGTRVLQTFGCVAG